MTLGRTAVLVALVLWGLGCEKGSDPAGEIQSIDLSVGSAWTYRWHVEQYASDGSMVWDTTSHYIVVVSAINQSVGPYQGCVLLEARDRDNPAGTAQIWYAQTSERLTEVAYRTSGAVPIIFPKRENSGAQAPSPRAMLPAVFEPFLLQQGLDPSALSDSIQIRQEPRVVYVYPLGIGAAWVSFQTPFLQERTVEDYADLAAQGGTYHCARIRTTIPDFAPGLEWIDHVSSQGLVRRTFDSWVQLTDPLGGALQDSVHVLESIELLAH